MTWPNRLKSVAVVSTPSPVTVTALVEVKAASIQEIETPGFVAAGSLSSRVPKRMITAKPIINRRGAWARDKRWSAASLEGAPSPVRPGRSKRGSCSNRSFNKNSSEFSFADLTGSWLICLVERLSLSGFRRLLPTRTWPHSSHAQQCGMPHA